MCIFYLYCDIYILLSLANAAIQLPKAAIDLFIFLASSSFYPLLKVFDNLSLPARSTIVNNPFLRCFY